MGQKVHPIGFRIGIIRDWESTWYADKDYPQRLKEDHEIRALLRKRLSNAGISRIVIDRQADKVRVSLHTAKPGVVIGKGGRGVDELRADLEKRFNRQIHLNIIEEREVDAIAQLVAENIAQQIERRISPRRAIRGSILRARNSPNALGIKILVSGRLGGAEIARKETDKWGKIPLHTLRADIDYGFAEAGTTYGNIGVKVWIYRGEILPDRRLELKTNSAAQSFLPRAPRRSEDRGPGPGGGGGRGSGGGGRGGSGGGSRPRGRGRGAGGGGQ